MAISMKAAGRGLTLAFAMCMPALVHAQAYPSKPIRMIVGFPPGGNVDMVGRIVAQKMSQSLGQMVVVEPKTGAAGLIANQFIASAPPDGYTILLAPSAFVTQAATKAKLPYSPTSDFTWISRVLNYPFVVVVRADSPFKTLEDLIDHAKKNPGKMNYAIPGIGTAFHLATELFTSMAGIEMVPIPYRGGSEPMTELLAGRSDFLFEATTTAFGSIKAGKLRALAVTSQQENPVLPGVPPISKTLPGYEAISFIAIGAPAGTPPEILNRLNAEIERAVKLPDVSQRFVEWGADTTPLTPEQTTGMIRSEIGKWRKVVTERNIALE
jgi:tripartite-type tricarboxylate transporter receptor subunit TctC